MKTFITTLVIFLLPLTSLAATVQVYPTMTNAYGGTKHASDIYTEIYVDDILIGSEYGVPTYEIPAGNYEVRFFPPVGYEALVIGGCTDYIDEDSYYVCNVHYKDGADTPEKKKAHPLPPTIEKKFVPVETIKAVGEPEVFGSQISAPKSGLSFDQVNAIINLLWAFGVDQETVDLIYNQLI